MEDPEYGRVGFTKQLNDVHCIRYLCGLPAGAAHKSRILLKNSSMPETIIFA
jgi:hypothetical protein